MLFTRVVATSFMLIGAVSFVAVVAAPDMATAKNGNGGGKGGGNGGGKGGGNGNSGDKAGGKSDQKHANGKAGKAGTKTKSGKGLLGSLGLKKTKNQKTAKTGTGGKKKNGLMSSIEKLVKGNKKPAKLVRKTAIVTEEVVDEQPVHPNKHGKVASELKGLNAAHASQTALMNASPNSMPGKLYSYQQSVLGYKDASTDLLTKQGELSELQNLTDEQVEEQFAPTEEEQAAGITAEDKHNDAVKAAETEVEDAEKTVAESDPQEALDTLTGGRELSDDAVQELHDLLGLPEPEEYDVSIDDTGDTVPDEGEGEVTDG